MSKRELTGKRAVWFGLLGTPVLLVAAVTLLGVAAGSAGPSKSSSAAADTTAVTHATQQTAAQVEAYWTPARMAEAEAYPITKEGPPPGASVGPAAQPDGPPGLASGALPGGVKLPAAAPAVSSVPAPQHHTYDTEIPFTRWSLIGRYTKYPNSTILKMFFSQDHDGNGTGSNFVCSASTMGPDEAWTAGHCVTNNLNGAGFNAGWSYNVLVCPSYDSPGPGVDPTLGCWGSDNLWTLGGYRNGGGGNIDFGGIDTTNVGTVVNAPIGNAVGWLGFAWNWARGSIHWVALGYPQGSPFAGGKIIMAASEYGYDDNWSPDGVLSVAMGSDLTGGSSGGPWIWRYGLPGQVGGLGQNYINGHNDWKWNNRPNRMMSPYFDCRPMAIYNALLGTNYCT
jgi:hypothetical protein